MTTQRATFRSNIKRLRKVKGWTQQETANKLGLKIGTYAKYEEGRSEPDLEGLHTISIVYGISLDELITNKTSNPKYKDLPQQEARFRALEIRQQVEQLLKVV